jgi:hypothetical protein
MIFFRKPAPTFRDHALMAAGSGPVRHTAAPDRHPPGSPESRNDWSRRIAALLCLLFAVSMAAPAQAHGGLSMEKDYCKLRIGPYFMHFSGYQPERDATKEFCEDIPATGATIIVLDFVDAALKDLPVEVRIVRDGGGDTDLDRLTVVRLSPKLYPTGSLSLDFDFEQPGNYVGFVSAGSGDRMVSSRFPFSVGATRYLQPPLLMGLVAIGLGGAYGLWRWRRAGGA